jgi:hypothetical protein
MFSSRSSAPAPAPPTPDAEYAYYEAVATRVQARAAVDTFLALSRGAFDACAATFTTPALTPAERKCVTHHARKYVAVALRVSARVAEAQEPAARAAADAADARLAAAAAAADAAAQPPPAAAAALT